MAKKKRKLPRIRLKLVTWIALWLMAFLLPLAWMRVSQPEQTEAAWWNDAWHYRQRVDVTNNTSEEANVYIALTLDTSDTTKFQANCGDLRFTRQNGQLLQYYLVSGCGTASTSVHVQFDTFPAGAQSVYAYYGNAAAEDGFASADFSTEASNYTIGGVASEEVGPGPVAYWKFDEGSGTTANDSAGDNNGTISGATWTSEEQCVRGKCLSFDGYDYVDVGNTGAYTNNFTISAWINPSIIATQEISVLEKRNGTTAGWAFGINANGTSPVAIWRTFNSGSQYSITGTKQMTKDSWYYLTVVQGNDSASIYVNGVLDRTLSINNPAADSTPFRIGYLNGGAVGFSGQIDEVKIFPYALTEDQIKTEYNLGSATVIGEAATVAPPPNGTLKDSLVAHWSFDEQAGQTVHDKVGGNDGTRGADANAGSDDPTWKPASECKVNGCLGFDGTDGYDGVFYSSSVDFDISDSYSINTWAKITDAASVREIIHSPNGSGKYPYRIYVNTSSTLVAAMYNGTSSNSIAVDYSSHFGKWTHISLTKTPSQVCLYINGVLATNCSNFTLTGTTLGGSGSLRIGRHPSNVNPMKGLIDEVKIYNTALTSDQVKQDMNAGAAIVYGVTANEADELSDGAGDPPIAEWKFDEKQGTTAYDTSGNENNGTVNGATWKSACKQGACLEFDGVDDYVSAGSNPITGTSAFTLEGWLKPASHSTYGLATFIGNAASSQSAWIGWVTTAQVGVSNTIGGGFFGRNYGSGITDNDWHHVTLTFSGGSNGIAKLYVDGIEKVSDTYTPNLQSNSIVLGKANTGTSYWFNGQIDHVKIYDYARTPAQIAYDYNRGKPIAHWKFDECEGTVAHDSSGNDNHGTINIGATGSQSSAGTCQTSGAWGNGASGKFNGSLNFDDTDDYVSILPDPTQNLAAFSIAAWVKLPAFTPNDTVLGNWEDLTTLLRVSSSGMLEGYFRNPSSIQYGGNFNAPSIPLNRWTHVTMTFDGIQLKGFVNGKIGTSVLSTGSPTSVKSASSYLGIGGANRTGSEGPFNGQIDDVRIYNYALSTAQVQKVMNEGMAVRYGTSN